MKKLLSLILAVSMLASAYAPAVSAVSDLPAGTVQQTATPENAQPAPAPQAAITAQSTTATPAQTDVDVTPYAMEQMPALSYRVTTADGIDFTSADPFSQFTLTVGKEYTFTPLVEGQSVAEKGYTLMSVSLIGNPSTRYLEIVSTDSNSGSFVVKALAASGGTAYLDTIQLNFTRSTDSMQPVILTCTGNTVADNGQALFVDKATGAPVSSLTASQDSNSFTLSLAGFSLDETTQTIEYGTSAPDSISIQTDGLAFGTVNITVNRAISSDTSFYANVKALDGTLLSTASLTLRWSTPIQADQLPGGSQIYFGSKEDSTYRHWYSAQYTQLSSTADASLQVFFGVPQTDGYTVDYSDLPVGDTIQSISVESLSDKITILNQTPQSGEDPFSFQYRIDLTECTTAQLRANVTLTDGKTYSSLFTITITEPVEAQELTVKNTEELRAALANPALVAGSTIYLESGVYTDDFVVTTPVTLIAKNYDGTQLPYEEDGSLRPDKNATEIQGTITAKAQNVNVIGLRFEAQEEGLTALTDACLISGCTFSCYETAVALSQTVQNSSNYRLSQNAFVDNGTAILFAGREWLSNVQHNSFLNNDCAVHLASGCYIDGPTSQVYGGTVNGGKWTNNLFRGEQDDKVLLDERTDNADTLLLNYNYFAYGNAVGAVDSLFTTRTDTACNHSVYYTSPAMDTVTTGVSLADLASSGGLDLVAQQQDTAADSALNVSGTLFDTLQTSSDAEDLQLNVWTADEEVAANWDFEKSGLSSDWAGDSVNLGVSQTLATAESAVVDEALPEGVTAQPVHFAHEGDLPGTATVQVPLTADLDPNQTLGLYYINEDNGTLERQDTAVSVTDTGMVQFEISHCSSYLVAPRDAMEEEPAAPDPAKVVTIDCEAETLHFDNDLYEVNSNSSFTGAALADGASLNDYAGQTLYIRLQSTGAAPAGKSAAFTVPARPAAPTGLTTEPAQYQGEATGRILGVDTTMEYRPANQATWTPCTGSEVTGLAAGDYEVRKAATDSAFAGTSVKITIADGPARSYGIEMQEIALQAPVYGGTPVAVPVVLTNTGNCDVKVRVTVDSNSFVLEGGEATLAVGESLRNCTLQPASGLNAGHYAGSIHIFLDDSSTAYQTASIAFDVLPRDVTPVWPAADFTYDGTEKTYMPTLEGVLTGDTVSPTFSTTSTTRATAAGQYRVQILGVNNANYQLAPNAATEQTWTIQKRAITIAPQFDPSNRLKAGQDLPTVAAVETGAAAGETLLPEDVSFTGLPADTKTPGDYPVNLTESSRQAILALPAAKNYSITFAAVTLTVLPAEAETLPLPPEMSDKDFRLEQSPEVKGVAAPAYSTPQKVEEKLLQTMSTLLDNPTTENTQFHEITLLVSADEGKTWQPATGENFPKEGILVQMNYPDGLANPAAYDYTVLHMCQDGTVERPAVTKTKDGLEFTLYSLSPIALSWAPAKAEPVVTEPAQTAAPDTAAPSKAPADDTVYYVCPACGHHNWTATDNGYRCDNCGYLESVKQLSGYGNVQGVYTPVSSSQAASAGSGTLIPTTGDESQPLLWVALMVVAALALGGALYAKYKHDRKK